MPDNFCTIYLVRHAQSEQNKAKIATGHIDTPLSPEGEQQAAALAGELRHINFDAAYSSDLVRARRTAEIIKLERTLAVRTTERIRERHYGPYQGKPMAEYLAATQNLAIDLVPDGVETNEAVIARFITFLREVAVAHPNQTILIVGHGSVIRTFLGHVGFSKEMLPPGSFSNTGYAKLLSDGTDFFIKDVVGIKKKEFVATAE